MLSGQYSPILSHPKHDKQWASRKMPCDVKGTVFSQFKIEGGTISSGPRGQTSTVLIGKWFHLLFPIRDTEAVTKALLPCGAWAANGDPAGRLVL